MAASAISGTLIRCGAFQQDLDRARWELRFALLYGSNYVTG
jgi:hypothetical protein